MHIVCGERKCSQVRLTFWINYTTTVIDQLSSVFNPGIVDFYSFTANVASTIYPVLVYDIYGTAGVPTNVPSEQLWT